VEDFHRHLSFMYGKLRFEADYVRGRLIKTVVEISKDGTILIKTINRADLASQWVEYLLGKRSWISSAAKRWGQCSSTRCVGSALCLPTINEPPADVADGTTDPDRVNLPLTTAEHFIEILPNQGGLPEQIRRLMETGRCLEFPRTCKSGLMHEIAFIFRMRTCKWRANSA
jgi:hypothetical protein